MKSLADIVHDSREVMPGEESSLATVARSNMMVTGLSILGGVLGKSKASQFASETADLVTSRNFLDELEANIGKPQTRESEEEFVARAKLTMLALLTSKLS